MSLPPTTGQISIDQIMNAYNSVFTSTNIIKPYNLSKIKGALFTDKTIIPNLTYYNWYTLFNKINSSFTIAQTGSDPDVQLQMNSSTTGSSQTSLWYDARIQNFSSFVAEFEIYMNNLGGDGASFNVGFNSTEGFRKGEGPNKPAFCLTFQVYKYGFRKSGIYFFDNEDNEIGKQEIDNLPAQRWVKVRVIYNRSTTNTWQIDFDGTNIINYDNPNNESWVTSSAGSIFGFGSRTGGATLDFYVRKFALTNSINMDFFRGKTFRLPNEPPTSDPIASITSYKREYKIENLRDQFSGNFSDPDPGDALKFSVTVSGNPLTVKLLSTTYTTEAVSLTLTGATEGSSEITVKAEDRAGESTSQTFQFYIANNRPSVTQHIQSPQTQTGNQRYQFNLNTYFTDPDGDGLTFSVSIDNNAITDIGHNDFDNIADVYISGNILYIDQTNRINGTVSAILVSASDGRGGSVQMDEFDWIRDVPPPSMSSFTLRYSRSSTRNSQIRNMTLHLNYGSGWISIAADSIDYLGFQSSMYGTAGQQLDYTWYLSTPYPANTQFGLRYNNFGASDVNAVSNMTWYYGTPPGAGVSTVTGTYIGSTANGQALLSIHVYKDD